MSLDESTVKRLVFIKYLYKKGLELSKLSSPMCSYSILTFHDSIELFLILAYLTKNGNRNTKEIQFMDYWNELEKLGVSLTQKGSIRRLNTSRVNLKHHGHLVSDLDIESFRVSTINFFEENTEKIFGINFSDLSLVNLIQCEEVKDRIKDAEKMIEVNNLEEALNKTALAFFYLIEDYESRKRGPYGKSPFVFGKSMTFLSSFHMGLNRTGFKEFDKLGKFVDTVKESVESLAEAVKILSLNIDYRKYVKFNLMTPEVVNTFDGPQVRNHRQNPPTKDEVEYCIDFVVDSSITLQDFDFDLESIKAY